MSLQDIQGQLILVVEDDPATSEVLCSVLEMNGMVTTSADSVTTAIKALALKPRFICLDLHLPDGLGTSVLRYVRQHAMPISVAIATATTDREFLARVAVLRPDRVLHKPYDLDDILEWVGSSKAA